MSTPGWYDAERRRSKAEATKATIFVLFLCAAPWLGMGAFAAGQAVGRFLGL